MLTSLIGPATKLLGKFIRNQKTKRIDWAHEITTMARETWATNAITARIEVLKADAKGNWFQSTVATLDWLDMRVVNGNQHMVSPIMARLLELLYHKLTCL